MENAESVLLELNRFEQLRASSQPRIPNVLEDYLVHVAKSGETLFPWAKIKTLIRVKMASVMDSFRQAHPLETGTTTSLDNFVFEAFREKVLQHIDAFVGIPFTIQRLAELVVAPEKHYRRLDKFMRALEKNLLVVSTVDPVSRTSQQTADDKTLLNGGHVSPNHEKRQELRPDEHKNGQDQGHEENKCENSDQEMEDVSSTRDTNTEDVNEKNDVSEKSGDSLEESKEYQEEGKHEDPSETPLESTLADSDEKMRRSASERDENPDSEEETLPPKRIREDAGSTCEKASKSELDMDAHDSESMSKEPSDNKPSDGEKQDENSNTPSDSDVLSSEMTKENLSQKESESSVCRSSEETAENSSQKSLSNDEEKEEAGKAEPVLDEANDACVNDNQPAGDATKELSEVDEDSNQPDKELDTKTVQTESKPMGQEKDGDGDDVSD